MLRHIPRALAFAMVLLGGVSVASASGFSIFEQGAKPSGLAGAWVASADDASANWYNPAALVWLEQREFQFGGNVITIGGDSEFTAFDPAFGIDQPTVFEPESSIGTPIHLYYAAKIGQTMAWGIGINNPYGLVTDWGDRPITFSAAKSELVTFNVNLNYAVQLTDTVSVALGVNYLTADVREFSRDVPVDLDGNPLNGFEIVGRANLTGDGDDVGFNLALHRRTERSAFGFTYRSSLDPDIEGDIAYSGFGPISPFFPDSAGGTTLGLPAQAQIGYAWAAGNAWWIEIDLAWAEWSNFDTLAIDIANETPFSTDFEVREDWDDTASYRVGVTRALAGGSELRFGVVFDESPVPANRLRPSIPDSDRTGVSIGWGRRGERWNVDLYDMALQFDEIDAVRNDFGSEGVVLGEYSSFTNLAGVTFARRF